MKSARKHAISSKFLILLAVTPLLILWVYLVNTIWVEENYDPCAAKVQRAEDKSIGRSHYGAILETDGVSIFCYKDLRHRLGGDFMDREGRIYQDEKFAFTKKIILGVSISLGSIFLVDKFFVKLDTKRRE